MSKVYKCKLNFYLSRTIAHRFLVHPEFVVNNSNDDNNDNNKRYKQSVSEERGNVEPC